ncbi:MAG: CAP domain-containing protein [Actinobacteria bacterium]|nr:CAP domain-containing protein [Actinomycetota bacterium]
MGAALLAAAAVATAAPAATHRQAVSLTTLEQGVLADINAFRAQNHLPALRLSAALTLSARSHSQQMAADGYFAHPSQDGTAFWKRVATFYPQGGFSFWSVGENLLWSSPDVGAQQAVVMWENSPEHRKNMLDPQWREIGISAVHVADATGVYGGRPVTIVTTDFGDRS